MVRFWSKVEKTDTCWLWTAACNGAGYGAFRIDGETRGAHRVAYELAVGPIPEGLQLDHLCRVRHCVNPAHLEAVPGQINVQRGDHQTTRRARSRCRNGHEYTDASLYWYRGWRNCRICRREADARHRAA